MASQETRSSFAQLSDGRKLSYQLSGPNSSPIVLLANSLCAPYHTWDHFVTLLQKQNFRILRFDQVGHGESTFIPSKVDATTFDNLSNDVKELLDSLKIRKLHAWIGISMGAATGIVFVQKNPAIVERLVVCDTISASPNALGDEDPFDARVSAVRSSGKIDVTVEQTLARWFSEAWREANEGEVERMRSVMSRTQVEGFAACCRALQKKDFDLRPLFKDVGGAVKKALLVVGENDANLPETMEEMRQEIQAGFESTGKREEVKLVVIKGAGHVSVVDGLGQYSEAVITFLQV
jgi:3-oxoadipate enol-lactonase